MTREEAKTWLDRLYMKADITDEYGDMEDTQPYEEAIDMAIKALEQEPKTGHWEWLTEDKYRCSNCYHETRVDECMNKPMYNYCPFCGAKMAESEVEKCI